MSHIFTTGIGTGTKTKPYKVTRDWITSKVISGLEGLPLYSEPATTHRASMFSVCPRQSVIRTRESYTSHQTASSTMYTSIGNVIHDLIQTSLFRSGLLLWKEYKAEMTVGNTKFTGSCDAIIIDPITYDLSVIDIKTTGAIPSKPKVSYQKQIAFYGLLLGIRSMNILYVSRNVGMPEPKIKNFTVDESYIEEVALDMAVTACLQVNELPNRLKTKSSCTYCPLISRCWNDVMIYEPKSLTESTVRNSELVSQRILDTMKTRRKKTIHKILKYSNNNIDLLEKHYSIILNK